jgi:TPR repeat protein
MTLDDTDRVKSSDLTLEQTVGLEANNLGYRYYTDCGIDQNYRKAASCFKLATAYGNSSGQYNFRHPDL